MKKKGKKLVPNCVPEEVTSDDDYRAKKKALQDIQNDPVRAKIVGREKLLQRKDKLDKEYQDFKNKKQIAASVEEDAPANFAGGGNIAGIGVGPDGEPGVMPKAAQQYKKKNKEDLKGRMTKFLSKFRTVKEEREMTASELASQASNDADLYKRQIQPIIKNLGRKKNKGIFNRDLAIKLFRYAIDYKVKQVKGAQSRTVPGTVRNDAAGRMLSSFMDEIDEFAKELSNKK